MTLIVVLLLLLQSLWTIWAGIDAMLQPDRAWREAGASRALTLTLLVVTCSLGTIWYYLVVRPRVRRAQGLDT
jgi:hypothetical protein